MERKVMVAIAALALASCATPVPKPVFIGKPIDAVVKHLGYPEHEREFEGDKIYSWSYGYIKARYIFIHDRETCTVDVAARDGIIKNIAYSGDSGPCYSLEDMLLYGK